MNTNLASLMSRGEGVRGSRGEFSPSPFLPFPPACALMFLLAAFVAHAADALPMQPAELFSAGDFDGDGRSDLLILDKATGNYTVGYQLSLNAYTWVRARASGIENATGLSVGRILNLVNDAFAVCGPEANRLNILDASNPSTAGLPVSFHASAVGPTVVVALDIVNPPPHDDFFLASAFNNGPADLFTLVRNNAGSMTELATFPLTAPLDRGERVLFKTGQPILAGVMRRDPLNTFLAYRLTGGVPVVEASLSGLPADCDYVWGQFSGSPLSQFLFFVPGQSNLLLRPIQEPAPFTFGAGSDFAMGDALGQVFTIAGSTPRLLIVFAGATRAAVYDFNGVSAPTLRQQFNAAAGETFTGAGVLGGGNFMMYSSRDGSGRSTFFQAYNFNGSTFVAGANGNLPSLNALSARGNVLLFQKDPLTKAGPNLLKSLNAGDWSSQLSPLPGLVSVQAESFASSSQGLSSPVATSLGASPALASAGLVNQYSNFFSLFSLNPAEGDDVSDVHISPAPGLYQKGVVVSFTAADASHQIFYRLAPGDPWTSYSGAPTIRLFKNTIVQFYGKPPLGNTKSRIKSAAYSFTQPPGTLDSDGDGIPDYVEIAKGLDPLRSGNDADGDGYFDLDELLAGTNPNDPGDPPAATPIQAIERQAVFDLAVTPRPWDGTVSAQSLSITGTAVRSYNLAGSLLAYGKTANTGLPGVTDPAARLTDLSFDKDERLLAVATEEHFPIDTAGTNKLLGRELIGLLPLPALRPPFEVSYNYGGGALATEANNWLAAATASNALTHRAIFSMDLTIYDSLAALLVERKVSELLLTRGVTAASNLTLFGFRPTEASRYRPDLATLLSLESRGMSNQPGSLLQTMLNTIQSQIMPGGPAAMTDLRSLTADVYRLSSASNNAAPGVYPSPVDTLRDFIATGVLHSNYLARTLLSPVQLANAYAGVAVVLAAVPGRPTTSIELRVRPDSFTGPCTVLETTALVPALKYLFHPGGEPYHLLEAFSLVPGTRVQVLAYTDMSSPACPGDGLEVITLQLAFVPQPSPTDLDGDLLPDEWEALFGISDPFGDDDGDGYSNLQEMFEGTDPRDSSSKPSVPAKSLAPPEITVETMGGGTLLKLSWDWPEPYASKVKFKVQSSVDLGMGFTDSGLTPTKTGGHFELILPNPGIDARFFFLTLQL